MTDIKIPKILVIGDVIVDTYWHGITTRVSPEAPVPILLKNKDEDIRLGGACNVALNIASLGGQVELIGVIGDDNNGAIVEEILKKKGIKTFFVKQKDFNTIKKMRILSRNQQLLRLDSEEKINEIESKKIVDLLQLRITKNDIFVFSDYGKGTLLFIEDLIANIKMSEKEKKIIIDPKGTNFSKYKNASIITPNLNEFREIVGPWENDSEFNKKANNLLNQLNLNALLITKGGEGISLFIKNKVQPINTPSKAKEVYDVTGAGDTVIATLTYYLGIECPLIDAVKIANLAAGIIVGKAGTAIINKYELKNKLIHKKKGNKVVAKLNELAEELEFNRKLGKKIVFTNGVFDIIHYGHIKYLNKTKECGDILIVAVNDDNSVKMLNKGAGRPINCIQDRMAVLEGFSAVDWILAFSESTPEKIIKYLKPDFLIKGGDYKINEIAGYDYVLSYGGIVKTIPFEEGYSTSKIIDKILKFADK